MMDNKNYIPTRAQISRAAINRLHVSMRHLFLRGSYKPLGASGAAMIESLLSLNPEIYGTIADDEKVEINGLLYIFQRLPQGIEKSRYVKLIGREGFEKSPFEALIPSKRRRNCYRIDDEQMYIEMTRGRSDIYDVLTHLTFMYVEAEKIRNNALSIKDVPNRAWEVVEGIVKDIEEGNSFDNQVGLTYLSTLLGRTYNEVYEAVQKFDSAEKVNSLFVIVYWLGKRSMEEYFEDSDREISFSSTLREMLGHHYYGERWATQIKKYLYENGLFDREIHVVSSNLHSVMNSLYANEVLNKKGEHKDLMSLAGLLSNSGNKRLRDKVKNYALKNGMKEIDDNNGTNISVQIFDTSKVNPKYIPQELNFAPGADSPILIVMDYAFGEQAYETMDELLKPYEVEGKKHQYNVASVNIMGKAGILCGDKGDIMIPSAHIFEGSADNYVFKNDLKKKDFANLSLGVYEGPMITVLGTSLQNKDILRYFLKSSWGVIGLEMEGAHYQKAIQVASQIRQSVGKGIKVRYAYYASDNPLETGSTLASGSLGLDGVVPTYSITLQMLNGIFA